MASHTNGSRASPAERITFSFDSSGWLYVYHLGVAHFLQQRLLPGLDPELTAFSGSSGGALVAAALCANIDVLELTRCEVEREREGGGFGHTLGVNKCQEYLE
eukprot:5011135-Pleurochrysis_carterae.AAC.2